MPIYEYRCRKCGHSEEYFLKFSEKAPEECSSCHESKSLEKQVSSTSFQLKGGGWYKDLYSSPKKEDPKSSKEASKAPEKKDIKKTVKKTSEG